MRDLILVPIIAVFALMALRRPWIGVMLFVWVSVMNPHRLTYGFAYGWSFAIVAAAVTLVGVLFGEQRFRLAFASPIAILMVFVAWMAVTTTLAIDPGGSWELYVRFLKTMVAVVLALGLVQERRHILALLWTLVVSLGFYGVKGGLFTLLSGGSARVWGPPDSMVEGNNEIAVAFVMIAPLMYFLGSTLRKPYRFALYGATFLTILAALGSQSRGALLAVLAMSVMFWFKSKRKVVFMVGGLAVLTVILAFMPESWWARMETMRTYQDDGSAMGRIYAWKMAWNIATSRLTGAGFNAWTPVTYAMYMPEQPTVLVAHSIYFHVLGDHGFIGLALFLAMWFSTYRLATKIRARVAQNESLAWVGELTRMTQVSLVGYFVGGAFLSLPYWDVPYFLMVLIVVLHRFVSNAPVKTTVTAVGAPQSKLAP